MRLLLDESVPGPLRSYFPTSCQVETVQLMGWAGRSNGDLLALAAESGFDAFVTADQGIEYQQSPDQLSLPVIVLIAHRTRLRELRPLVPQIVDLASDRPQRQVYRIDARSQ